MLGKCQLSPGRAGLLLLMAILPAPPAQAKSITLAYARIGAELASRSSAGTKQAVGRIDALVSTSAYQCRLMLRDRWLPALMAQKQYQAVAELAQLEILNNPDSTNTINILQAMRVQALLAAGQAQAALAAAKGLFNIATMQNTANALMLVAKCLKADSPNGLQLVNQLQRQQRSGAEIPGGNAKAISCTVLADIQVNPKPYLRAAGRQPTLRVEDLIGKGNLLLLADKPRRARIYFDQAYSVAWNNQWLVAATERIAACIKAQDGTIGRANAWVLAIRPKPVQIR